ncbi:Hypothetical_protein [Hexamita inflata]|uniref:Hypothetical_protein n=1 Tax=Hexamita inflata TaxID=28002 RepID=A0AA86QGR7_9EUKA|nr:Hypothetical protein HINF_LOCUS43617 [Hexamita inflata]
MNGGVCQCKTSKSFVNGSSCQCGAYAFNDSKSCTCFKGTQFQGYDCVQIICQTGYYLSGSTCYQLDCPSDQMVQGNVCVNRCSNDMYWTGYSCNSRCDSGWTWAQKCKKCIHCAGNCYTGSDLVC